jgi:hypothetical protein
MSLFLSPEKTRTVGAVFQHILLLSDFELFFYQISRNIQANTLHISVGTHSTHTHTHTHTHAQTHQVSYLSATACVYTQLAFCLYPGFLSWCHYLCLLGHWCSFITPVRQSPLEPVSGSIWIWWPQPHCPFLNGKFIYCPSGQAELRLHKVCDFLRMHWLFPWQEKSLPPSWELSFKFLPLFFWQFGLEFPSRGHLYFSTVEIWEV